MSWFRKKNAEPDSETLRDALFTAIGQGDGHQFAALCNQYAPLIVQYFDGWKKVPQNIRGDREAVDLWGHCLITIAGAFESAGHPQLLASLMGPPGDNPITRWVREFTRASHLSETGQYQESNAALLKILDEMQGSLGSAIDDSRPKVYGLLGTNFFRMDDPGQARKYTELALRDCERTGDQEGVSIYTENLATLLAADPECALAQCRRKIARAQDLSDQLRYAESTALLHAALGDIEQNPELRSYRSKVHGLMGSNFFRLGETARARELTERAVQDCEADRDDKGVRIYRENLRVISGQK